MPGIASASIGRTVICASGNVAVSWATIPPERVSEPVSEAGLPRASDLERVGERRVLDRQAAGRPGHDRAGDDAHAVDRQGLGTGIAQLVEEVLDARPVDRAGHGDPDARTR